MQSHTIQEEKYPAQVNSSVLNE